MERATNKQKQIIHLLEHQLIVKEVLDDEGYRLILRGLLGRESSKDLSHAEASLLSDQLVKMGGEITSVPKHGSEYRMKVRLGESSFRGEKEHHMFSSFGGKRMSYTVNITTGD